MLAYDPCAIDWIMHLKIVASIVLFTKDHYSYNKDRSIRKILSYTVIRFEF